MIASVFAVFVVTLLVGLPICLTVAVASVWPVWAGSRALITVPQVIRAFVTGADSTPMLAVPLFILSGIIMAKGGISKKLFDFFAYFIGKRRAGMPCAVIVTCLFFGAISGSGAATTAAVGAMTIPILLELGYDKVFCAALVASAGGLGVIIPPSVPFVLYGLSSGASVGQLFLAGIIPGCLVAALLMAYAYWHCFRHGEDRARIEENYEKIRARGLWRIFRESFFALLSPVIILGSIYSGIVTPTEAAAISVLYAWIVSLLIYRTIGVRDIIPQMKSSVKGYAPIVLVLAFASAFAKTLTLMKAPAVITTTITSHISSPTLVMLFIVVIFLFIGMFIDTAPAIVVLAPILLPIVRAYGVNEIHFGVILVVSLAVGLVSPPFGIDLFVAAPMVNEPVMKIGRAAMPFIISIIVALLLVTFIPQLSLLLL